MRRWCGRGVLTVAVLSGSIAGAAAELSCVDAIGPAARKARVRRVYVSVYQNFRHGRCRFLSGDGRLSARRSCARPIEFRARGTAQWSLRRRLRIPRGSYLIRADAVDGFGHHQRRSGASVIRVRVY